MKRCPQCDFKYDDDQSLCDMDGRELERVHEVSPRPHAAKTRPPRATATRRGRLPALPIAGVILGVALPAIYFVNTSQTATVHTGRAPLDATAPAAAAPRPENSPAPEATAHAPEPPPEPPATKVQPEPPATKVRPAAAAPRKRSGATAPAVAPSRKPSPPPPSAERQAGAPSPQGTAGKKKESKLGAVLKKTGRILKKPFGF